MSIESVHLSRIQVPLRHAYVSSKGVRRHYRKTVVRLATENGLTGYGETDGSDVVFARACELASGMLGHELPVDGTLPDRSPFRKFRSTLLTDRIAVGGIEMACWDIAGKVRGEPVCRLLGGGHRSEVAMVCELSAGPFASDEPAESIDAFFADHRNSDRVVHAAQDEITRGGYQTLKLKSVGRDADWDVRVMTGLREALGSDFNLRHDPNGAYSVDEAIALCRRLDGLNLQWFEDPTSRIDGMRKVRDAVTTPLATNMCAIDFDQLGRAIGMDAVDVVGIDPFHWAGLANAQDAISVCRANGLNVYFHCFFDLGITTAAMLHLAACTPELPNGMDTCLYLQGTDIIQGGEFKVRNGCLDVPTAPGLGIAVDEAAVKRLMIEEYKDHYEGPVAAP